MPTIEYADVTELQAIVAQFDAFQSKQLQAKRLCGNAVKMLRDAEALFNELATESQPGGAMPHAAALTGGWLSTPLEMSDQNRTIAEGITELIGKLDDLHAFMADFQAAYAAGGRGQFFTDLPAYTG